jgi:hypothetical protein
MKVTAFGLLLFFVALNVSLYVINETAILPYYKQSPYEEPQGIINRLVHLDLSTSNLAIGGAALTVFIILGWITGHLLFGGTVAIVLFAMSLLFEPLKWLIFGFPTFLGQMGVPLIVYTPLTALMSVVFFWFLLGFVAQRQLED